MNTKDGRKQVMESICKELCELNAKRLLIKLQREHLSEERKCLVEKSKEISVRKMKLEIEYLRLSGSSIFCPRCGNTMKRVNFRGNAFYGCSKYPECKGSIPKYKAVK